jgi:hypothetical protein
MVQMYHNRLRKVREHICAPAAAAGAAGAPQDEESRPGPLKGVKVLDMTTVIARELITQGVPGTPSTLSLDTH